jgi:ubiquinone/menaquinone biosynthesis C-methylase UbiE
VNPEEYAKMFSLEDYYWWFVGRRRLAIGLLKRALANSPSERPRVLDLGCGTGVVLRDLEAWAEPIGVDMSPHALNFCRKRGLAETIQGDGVCLPLQSEVVDAVIGLDIFEHIQDDVAAFEECFRVMKPGGIIVLSVPAFKSLWGPHDIALMHQRRYRRGEVRARLENAGFKIQRASYSVFFLFPVVVVWRMFEKRKRGPATASLVAVPRWLNTLLIKIQDTEAWLIAKADLSWGSSVVAVAQKPTPPFGSAGA